MSAGLLLTAALALAGCGTTGEASSGAAQPPSGIASTATPSPSSAAATPAPGQVLGDASNAAGWYAAVTAQPGAQMEVTVTVPGPITVEGGCVPTLTASADTLSGTPVSTPTPGPALHCLAIALVAIPAGSTRAFTTTIPEPSQPGTYVVEASLRSPEPSGSTPPRVTISV
ncbi:MAG: hypothetical protein WCB85_10325 [Candidatus Dormiibacterota bacterium]